MDDAMVFKDLEPLSDNVIRLVGSGIEIFGEVLVAADIVKTIAHELTFISLGLLAGLVLVRTFLSWTLVLEIEGRWPWQREPSPMSSRAGPGRILEPR